MRQENQFQTFQTSSYFFRKALHEVKGSGLQFSFNIFQQHSIWYTIKTNCVKLGPEIWSIQTFQKRVQGQFLHYNLSEIFQEKSYSCYTISWSNFIVWLPLLPDILGNMCITIICFLSWDVKNFKKTSSFYQAVFLHDQKFKTKIQIS